MNIEERFHDAALDVCRWETAYRAACSARERCTEMSKPDYRTGDPGQGPCYLEDEEVELCQACTKRRAGVPALNVVKSKRRYAKRKLFRAYATLTGHMTV